MHPAQNFLQDLFDDRRYDPRFPLDAPVRLHAAERSVDGTTVDASVSGLLVRLEEPLPFLDHQVTVEVTMDGGGAVRAEGDIVRRALSPDGDVLVALRLLEHAGARQLMRRAGRGEHPEYGRRRRPSRAKPRPRRPVAEIRYELRGVGARVLELALAEPDGAPASGLVRWVERIGAELGASSIDGSTNRGLLREIARLHARAGDASAVQASR